MATRRLRTHMVRAALVATIAATCAQHSAADVCSLEIEGIWKPATALGDEPPLLLSFSGSGSVTMLEPSAEKPTWEFEQLGALGYQLLPRARPERIEFDVRRRNDFFAQGTTVWQISRSDDERFWVRMPESQTGEERQWSRVQTRRYFLTLAARAGHAESGGPAVFAMWTKLDGQNPWLEAMGAYAEEPPAEDGDERSRFGRIPHGLASEFATESDLGLDVMMRIELSEAEYLRTHRLLESWDVLLRTGFIAPEEDPYLYAFGLIVAAVESANACALKLNTEGVDLSEPSASAGEARVRERAQRLVRRVREVNDRWHVRDETFPFGWKPPPVIPRDSS